MFPIFSFGEPRLRLPVLSLINAATNLILGLLIIAGWFKNELYYGDGLSLMTILTFLIAYSWGILRVFYGAVYCVMIMLYGAVAEMLTVIPERSRRRDHHSSAEIIDLRVSCHALCHSLESYELRIPFFSE